IESDAFQRAEPFSPLVEAREQLEGLRDRQVEHLADGAALPADLEHLGLKARAVALCAGHVNIREELHLDAFEALAGARLAAAARDVERERRRGVAAQPRRVGGGEAGPEAV